MFRDCCKNFEMPKAITTASTSKPSSHFLLSSHWQLSPTLTLYVCFVKCVSTTTLCFTRFLLCPMSKIGQEPPCNVKIFTPTSKANCLSEPAGKAVESCTSEVVCYLEVIFFRELQYKQELGPDL